MIKGRDLIYTGKNRLEHQQFPLNEVIGSWSNDDLYKWANKHKITAHFDVISSPGIPSKEEVRRQIPRNAFILAVYKSSSRAKKATVVFAKEKKRGLSQQNGKPKYANLYQASS